MLRLVVVFSDGRKGFWFNFLYWLLVKKRKDSTLSVGAAPGA